MNYYEISDGPNILFLWLNTKEFHAMKVQERGINVEQVFRNVPKILKAIRRVHIELDLPFISFWISEWKEKILDYDVVIIHASKLTPPVVRYIRRKNPNIRIIVWYWNPVEKSVGLGKFENDGVEIWSFDEYDCEKYKIKYNTQYYFKNVVLPKTDNNIDVFFVGGDKGRIGELVNLKTQLDNQGISNYFHITLTGKENPNYKEFYSNRISYDEVLKHIASCKVIVDYVSDNQSGLTLRPLEALFYKKKLITNDKSIENRDFYCKDNIFIIGKDEFKDLKAFIEAPYREIRENLVSRYDFSEWINRFLLD